MSVFMCFPGRIHQFSTISGWCLNGCGVRDDGRVVNKYGEQLQEPVRDWAKERMDQ